MVAHTYSTYRRATIASHHTNRYIVHCIVGRYRVHTLPTYCRDRLQHLRYLTYIHCLSPYPSCPSFPSLSCRATLNLVRPIGPASCSRPFSSFSSLSQPIIPVLSFLSRNPGHRCTAAVLISLFYFLPSLRGISKLFIFGSFAVVLLDLRRCLAISTSRDIFHCQELSLGI